MRKLEKMASKYCGCNKRKYAEGGEVEPESTAVLSAGVNPELLTMLKQYVPQSSVYQDELLAARKRAAAESEAFQKMILQASENQVDPASSKAEMYFRLAAALGAPTKTGQFGETLSNVGAQLADYGRNKKAAENQKRQFQLEVQKLRSSDANEELKNLRALSSEELKDRRAILQKMIEQYSIGTKPQSSSGRQALDEGLGLNTPEYRQRVKELGDLNAQKTLVDIQTSLGNLAINQKNAELQQKRLDLDAEKAKRFTSAELELKKDTEDALAATQSASKLLSKAFTLNKNSFGNSALEIAQRKALELSGSKNERLLNTRLLENMLGDQALNSLKATFGAAPTEGERKILLDLQGIGAKTIEERSEIIRKAYKAAANREQRARQRLEELKSGRYATTEE